MLVSSMLSLVTTRIRLCRLNTMSCAPLYDYAFMRANACDRVKLLNLACKLLYQHNYIRYAIRALIGEHINGVWITRCHSLLNALYTILRADNTRYCFQIQLMPKTILVQHKTCAMNFETNYKVVLRLDRQKQQNSTRQAQHNKQQTHTAHCRQ